jgi:hypothetical protein
MEWESICVGRKTILFSYENEKKRTILRRNQRRYEKEREGRRSKMVEGGARIRGRKRNRGKESGGRRRK